MKKMVICKACGHIMEEARLGDRCPACGAARKMFESYIDTMGEKRRRVLSLHLHPIAVHFPTAFAVAILVLSLATPFLAGQIGNLLFYTMQILALFLPLVVLLAMLVGLLDGKIRFRHIKNSQILKIKLFASAIYFVLAVALALVIWLKGFQDPFFTLAIILMAAGTIGCSVFLSSLGMSITNSAFPGE